MEILAQAAVEFVLYDDASVMILRYIWFAPGGSAAIGADSATCLTL